MLNNAELKMEEQKKVIKDTFYSWKGDKEQIDDVMIVGFKISESYGDIEFL